MIKKILNPVKYMQDKRLLLLNVFVFCLGTFLAMFCWVRFDGVLDLHFLSDYNPAVTLADNVTNCIILSLMLFGLGKIINSKTRLIDCLNTAFYSRIPFYLLCLTNLGGNMSRFSQQLLQNISATTLHLTTKQYIYLGVISVVSLLALVLSISLLFNGFKVATHAKKNKHYVFFGLAIILAEILSTLILKNL
ncbi:hypothetical protein K5I29_10790 [Flavobacterium agricola]|uniref:Yip1 domain-containing protein n=1 Tax=Flavobacterium agricola TaxID=2870839 RepID=A0ABY6LXL0_9FLAO|nr:hypothetical protein [Flavobacterium agricola]UYW00974.1 hypothetical protein K5I29_10790 [Flavobacterium agricola]